jgi:hypothetical protein
MRDRRKLLASGAIMPRLTSGVEAESKSTAFVDPKLRDPEKAQALHALTENDLKRLETLSAEKVPRAAIKESWEILSKNIIETAKIFGFSPDEEGNSELKQAVHYLTLNVLESQEFMISVYALRINLDKVEKAPNADVSAKDAQDLVRACMAILTRPS